KGMLKSETSLTGKKEYIYDDYLRLEEVTETIFGADDKSFTFAYEYDSYGRLSKEIYPHELGEEANSTLRYEYDSYGYPVKKYLGATLVWEAKEYAEQGQLKKYVLGNNITVTKAFDDKGRLTNITSKKGSTYYQNMSYDYLGDGNMHYRTDALISKKEWFKYDDQNRLIGWEITSLNAAEPVTYLERISYTGNRITQKENIGNYGYESFPHHGVKTTGVTTIENYPIETTYDHNRIDGRARVSALTRNNNAITYTYGTADELIKKTEIAGNNSTTTYYAGGGRYELRVNNNTNSETKLLYLGSGIVKYDAPGTNDDKMLYLLKDHLGSIVKVLSINANNNVTALENFSYDVWGNRRNASNWSSSNITAPQYIFKGFTGHEHIDNFGLIHMKGRVYDPALGMFLSPDPYVQSMTAMGFNRYMYCMGNPLRFIDPDGEMIWFVPLIIGAVVGGVNGYMIGNAKGYTGVDLVSNIFFGAFFGAASSLVGGAVTSTIGQSLQFAGAGLIGAGVGSTVGGAMNGVSFAGLGYGNIGEAMWKGALSGLAGGLVGSSIGGGGGAFLEGATSAGVGSALYGGSVGEIFISAAIGGLISYGGYELQQEVGYKQYNKGNKPFGELTRSGFKDISLVSQRSFSKGKEGGGWILEDGNVGEIVYGKPNTLKLPERPNNARSNFHTHPNGALTLYEYHSIQDISGEQDINYVIGWKNIYKNVPGENAIFNNNQYKESYAPVGVINPCSYDYFLNSIMPTLITPYNNNCVNPYPYYLFYFGEFNNLYP
ncbi:hypothetical protein LJC25_05555, partial [Bacteroidales bacterium OttesenSCG-928-K03]|nr:hypothetical protein [Bacteroidales bacterium OttesenSCG-928-K03]